MFWGGMEFRRENQSFMKREEDTFEIDLGKLARFLFGYWWAILASAVILAVLAFGCTRFAVTPLYRSGVTIYVNNVNAPGQQIETITGSNLAAAQKLVSTYVNIIKSDTVLKDVIKTAKLEAKPEDIRKMMSAKQVEETEMFQVFISNPNPKTAAYIANAIANVAPKRIAGFVEGSSAKIVDYASEAEKPYTPSYTKNIALGFLLGAILACIVLTLRYLFDMRVKTEDDLKQYFDAPVLGIIPSFEQKRKSGYGYGYGYAQAGKESKK